MTNFISLKVYFISLYIAKFKGWTYLMIFNINNTIFCTSCSIVQITVFAQFKDDICVNIIINYTVFNSKLLLFVGIFYI